LLSLAPALQQAFDFVGGGQTLRFVVAERAALALADASDLAAAGDRLPA